MTSAHAVQAGVFASPSGKSLTELYASAPEWSGIKHRFFTFHQALAFAKYKGCRLTFLWGRSEGVGYCRYEDLFAPIPGVRIINQSEAELKQLEAAYRRSTTLPFRGRVLSVYRPGSSPTGQTIVFDLWGDFAETTALYDQIPLPYRPSVPLMAKPSAEVQRQADALVKKHRIEDRIGIRVRVTENSTDGRDLCRVQRKLDAALTSLIRLPWYVPVFIVTDSQYMERMLASHFTDSQALPKRFPSVENTGCFIDRKDPAAMRTYVMEIACLTACRHIINFGGFINQESLAHKIIEPTCNRNLFRLKAVRQSNKE